MKKRLVATTGSGDSILRHTTGNPHMVELNIPVGGTPDGSALVEAVLNSLMDDTELANGHHIVLHGEAVTRFLGYLVADVREYQPVDKVPGRLELPFTLNRFMGTRRLMGAGQVDRSRRVMQFEFKKMGTEKSYVATMHFDRNGEPVILVIPKKTALVAGHGTIASKVRWQLQRLGFEVYVLAHSPRANTRTAIHQGAPIILHPESDPEKFDANGMPYVSSNFRESLRSIPFDIVVEGLDGKSKGGVVASIAMKRYIAETHPDLPIVFQGGNDPDIAPRVMETQVMQVLGLGPDFVRGANVRSSVFIPSCNTHQYLHIMMAAYAWNKEHPAGDPEHIAEVEIDGFAIRRTGDAGGGKNEAHPDGSRIELNYHHAEDALAFDTQLPDDQKLPFARNADGTLRFSTDATFGPQQRYHILRLRMRAKKENGTFLTAKEFLGILKPIPRVAVVEFEGGKIDPGRIHNLIHNQLDLTHPYMEVITAKQSGDSITVVGLTYQESNVVPDNMAAALMITGLVTDDPYGVSRANGLANMALGLEAIKEAIEAHSPFTKEK